VKNKMINKRDMSQDYWTQKCLIVGIVWKIWRQVYSGVICVHSKVQPISGDFHTRLWVFFVYKKNTFLKRIKNQLNKLFMTCIFSKNPM